MSPLLAFFALTQACGLLVLIQAMRSAPEGYEDESGYHTTNKAGVSPKRILVTIGSR